MRLKNFSKVAVSLAVPMLVAGVGVGFSTFQSTVIVEQKFLPLHFGSMRASTVAKDSTCLVPIESVHLQFDGSPTQQRWVF
ncbi:hypothetical protein CER19_05065 [Pseudomonas sp. GL93]|uniref:hypothetical protein n=1 Tax=Pseudomonas sp. GL93 TaxID=2014741 RepID=UPI000E315EC3|nr:hypothetical protein [Pseudomonas sp. GL93]RFD32532.1 hypothetical protein CER19_05065 [Pseudomonas sp. GL93]